MDLHFGDLEHFFKLQNHSRLDVVMAHQLIAGSFIFLFSGNEIETLQSQYLRKLANIIGLTYFHSRPNPSI